MPQITVLGVNLVFALFVFMTASCGNKCSSPTQNDRQQKIKLGSVNWSEIGTTSKSLSKDVFYSLAERALGSLESPPNHTFEIVLKGELKVQNGEDSLVLEANIISKELQTPLRAGISATGKATNNKEMSLLVEKGLADLADSLKGLFKLVDAEPSRLIKALDSPEPDEQILALKLLGLKKARKAVSTIARLLTDPREQVAETAAEVLAEIGDEQAVPLLISAIQRGDLRSEVRAIEAMGRIGGAEAIAYLEMVAIGHEISEVRRLSKSLLKQIRSRKNSL